MVPRLADLTSKPKNNFDFIRFCLATFVLIYHSLPVCYGQSHLPHSPAARLTIYAGTSAVDCFFVISGFLILNSWERAPRAGLYLWKRVLRIYPGWLGLCAATAVVFGPLAALHRSSYWHALHPARLVKNALVLAGPDVPSIFLRLPLPGMVNASAWTLRYEFACYLGIAVLGLLGVFRYRALLLGLYVALCAANLLQATGLHILARPHEYPIVENPVSWLRLAPDFVGGMVAYLYRDRIYASLPLALLAGIVCLGLALSNPGWSAAAEPLLGAYFVIVLAFTPLPRIGDWAKHGDFSYGIYLYAFPIQQLVLQYFGHKPWFSVAALTSIAYALTLVAAILSWHGVEQPALKLKGVGRAPQAHPPILREQTSQT